MKKKLIISVLAIFAIVFIIVYAKVGPKDKGKIIQNNVQVKETETKIVEHIVPHDKQYEHSMMPVDCKSCHACDYPTKNDPCLAACPRTSLITVYHSPNEAPAVVHMNDVKGDYGEVTFSHKIHAEMSSFSIGCDGCHHYNTTGPVVKCKTCHSETRKREDLSTPDLEAAYHRQCLNCHRQWNRTTNCLECHVESKNFEKVKQEKISKYSSYTHPPLEEPKKILYKTKQKGGKFVTFYHNEHTNIYGISCKSCHKNDNCISCHDISNAEYKGDVTKQKKTHKSFEEHHNPCFSCHIKDVCAKCHADKPMDEFNHFAKTGFNLSKNHYKLSCNKCHASGSYKGLNKNCSNCHKEFADGKFDHKKAGVKLDDVHIDLSCGDCHKNNKFDITPKCDDCHDGFKFPQKVPGLIIKK
jgi:hypothetical protein